MRSFFYLFCFFIFFNESQIAEPEIDRARGAIVPLPDQSSNPNIVSFSILAHTLSLSFLFWLEVSYVSSFIEKIFFFYDIHVG